MSKDKTVQRWNKFLDRLSPSTKARLAGSVTATALDPENLESLSLEKRLSQATKDTIEASRLPVDSFPGQRKPMYCLVETPDGEFPAVRFFHEPTALALRLKEIDGEDVVAQIFYGFPVPITKAPGRAIILPNNTFVCLDPVVQTVSADMMDRDLLVQDDGFLGDEILSAVGNLLPEDEISANRSARESREDHEELAAGSDAADIDEGDDDDFSDT